MRVILTLLLLGLTILLTGCKNTPLHREWWRWVMNPLKLIRVAVLLSCLALVSCSLGPTHFERTAANGTHTVVTTAGVTILTRNQYEQATVTKGDFTATHAVQGKDEVAVPRYSAWKAVGVEGAKALGDITEEIVDGVTQ